MISDLISCRTALCFQERRDDFSTFSHPNTNPEKISFNKALNKIPLEFHDEKILSLYQNIGYGFDESKFYELLQALWKETFDEPFPIPMSLISTVPAAR